MDFVRTRLTRRGFALGAAAIGLAPLGARAEQARPGKVFLDYTQKELDDAYDQSVWAKNAQEVIKRYGTASDAVRARYKFDTKSYGGGEDEKLDIFAPVKPAGAAGMPIHLFVHGGAWRGGRKEMYSFPAPTFVESGAIFVAIGFSNIPKVRLPDMAHQVRSAIAWTYKNAKSFGGDPERLFVSGHSSGGHLCGVALVTDWSRYGVPPNAVKGGLAVSGMYELDPVMLSARSSYVKISDEEKAALSALRQLGRVACPVAFAYGDGESPEFKRQSRDMAAALKAKGKPSELIEVKGVNHFEIIETLGRPDGALGKVALRQMGRAA
ncbi:MAG: alpha/beta hydrolase [Alphaproteobacteria bacterium]